MKGINFDPNLFCGVYEGTFSDSRYYEILEGIRYGHDFDRFEGEFDNYDFRRGVMMLSNGDRYEGEFDGIFMHGRGVMVYANGDRLEGEWKRGEKWVGVMTFANGSRYEGEGVYEW